MQPVVFNNRRFYIKRDDLLNPFFSGNKARKFSYFLTEYSQAIDNIISYGSIQANSLYSLAALAKLKGCQLNYYCYPIPTWLKQKPIGNYLGALELGAKIIEVTTATVNLDSYMQKLAHSLSPSSLFIPEGGRCQFAEYGIKTLADEIIEFCQKQNLQKPLIFLPSGTGTTALYLQKHLPYQVLTCACVGDVDYLKTQWQLLNDNKNFWPAIIPTKKKYHFGKLYQQWYQLWQQLLAQTSIEFDLLYDPMGWHTLLEYLDQRSINSEVIYIHQGGLKGNESMLPRYQRKYG